MTTPSDYNNDTNSIADISIIIPCYNASSTLADQLEALLRQTVRPVEIIVADNGSTDTSPSIAVEYSSRLPYIRLVNASERQGVSFARNRGAECARSEVLAFCDADDIVAPEWVAAMSRALARYDFVASCQEHRLLNGMSRIQTSGLQQFDPPSRPHAGGSGLGIRRWLHRNIGGFDESMQGLEDTDYCLRAQEAGCSLRFVPDAVIHIRPRPNLELSERQAFNWGIGFSQLYAKHHKCCMVKMPVWRATAKLLSFYLRCCFQAMSDGREAAQRWNLNFYKGMLLGSYRYRVFALRVNPWGKPLMMAQTQ